jgi:hypothetical protein
MARYRPYAAAYAALARRAAAEAGPALADPTIRARVAEGVAAARCAVGEHRQETDDETGNEVCRYCRVILDDYGDTGLANQEGRMNRAKAKREACWLVI